MFLSWEVIVRRPLNEHVIKSFLQNSSDFLKDQITEKFWNP